MRPFRRNASALALLALLASATAAGAGSFVTFESGQVRPLALSADGTRLFAVNTPDDRLEIFTVGAVGLTHEASVPVGMEPVAVAVRSPLEVWVVNHLSDSVSIVDLSGPTPYVRRTLLVGDEPRDIVFAGPAGGRAFITTAHRGQQRLNPEIGSVPGAGDPQLTTPGVGRADVWVFDGTNPGGGLGGIPLRIVTLFGDTPRALATSADGHTVYAAVFKSGNRTTSIGEGAVCNGFDQAAPCTSPQGFAMPGGLPPPSTNVLGEPAPETGLIVKYDPTVAQWQDELGRNWSNAVRFSLPDQDVFAIDVGTLTQTAVFTDVGTTLFNMAVNPVTGVLYVSNTEARNEVRFEGPGTFADTTVQGHLAESRITVVSGGNVLPRHLNKHIDYDTTPAPAGTKAHSLATPVGMAVTPDGGTLYVAAFGSSKIGVFHTAALANDTFDPVVSSGSYIDVSGGGPSGLVLDAARNRLYVLTRFDDAVSVVDLATRDEIGHVPLHNPEPASVVEGRPFLYDAALTSSNGEAACASCHIFGDMDDLAWDLGNPNDRVKKNPIPINLAVAITFNVFQLPAPINGSGNVADFHPMKGPMTTQTLRGLKGSGAMHWRGDRANPPFSAALAFDENNSFNNFNPAFTGLLGNTTQLSAADMQKFTDFALQIMLPPNPNRRIDGTLTASQQAGRNFYMGPRRSDGLANDFGSLVTGFTCNGCHELNPAAGRFGTSRNCSFENEEQIFKIPHLRNMYQKIGMFGSIDVFGEDELNTPFQGNQIRGFGFLHDGAVDTLFRFFHATVFSSTAGIGGAAVGFQNDTQRRDVEQFMLAFDTNLAPAVGQQVTLSSTNHTAGTRIDELIARATAGDCDLIVKGNVADEARGWVLAGGTFQSDRAVETISDIDLRALATTAGQELTYTCVPVGSGTRAGIDRDEDGALDRDELDAGSDPSDPSSTPQPRTIGAKSLSLRDDVVPPLDPAKRKLAFSASTRDAAADHRVVPGAPGGEGDPTVGGATLRVYNADGTTTDDFTITLPASGWTVLGSPTRFQGYRFTGPSTGPIKRIVVKGDTITIRGGKSLFAYSLDEVRQNQVAVVLQLGSELGWCASAPAKTRGNPPSTESSDRPGRFVGAPKSPAPASCPLPPS